MTGTIERLQSIQRIRKLDLSYDLTNAASPKEIERLCEIIGQMDNDAQKLVADQFQVQVEFTKNPYFTEYFTELLKLGMDGLIYLHRIIDALKRYSAFSTSNIHEYPPKAVAFICKKYLLYQPHMEISVYYFLQAARVSKKSSDKAYSILLENIQQIINSKDDIIDPEAFPFLQAAYSQSVAVADILQFHRIASKNAMFKALLRELNGISSLHFEYDGLIPSGYMRLTKTFADKMVHQDYKSKPHLPALFRLSQKMGNISEFHQFVVYWSKSGYTIKELYRFIKLVRLGANYKGALQNYENYLKALYQYDYPQAFILADNFPYMSSLIYYAVAHHKKAFLRNLTVNGCMLELKPHIHWQSLLCDKENFIPMQNLNTLSTADIIKACDMNEYIYRYLCQRTDYSVKELAALWDKDGNVIRTAQTIYDRLEIENVDKRLLVIKQLKNYGLMPYLINMGKISFEIVIKKLSEMNLSQWIERRFSHIQEITPKTALNLMIIYDSHKKFIEQANHENHALFLWRNSEDGVFKVYNDLSEILNFIEMVDSDFLALADAIPLGEDFIDANRDRIKAFCLKGNAYIANQYRKRLNSRQKEGFGNLIKAELMGKFDVVKYNHSDISKELELKIPDDTFEKWTEDRTEVIGGYAIMETGGFDYTLRCGMLPYPTCLAYDDDKHAGKFLANFDTNKKILLVWHNNKIVGRAILRLTKVTANAENYAKELKFADVETLTPQPISEDLVLFLERMYYMNVNQTMQVQMQEALIEFTNAKAQAMGTYAVISPRYDALRDHSGYINMPLYIFISKTKADGEQYLDSVGGPASKKDEGTYYRGKDGFYLVNNEVSAGLVLQA